MEGSYNNFKAPHSVYEQEVVERQLIQGVNTELRDSQYTTKSPSFSVTIFACPPSSTTFVGLESLSWVSRSS